MVDAKKELSNLNSVTILFSILCLKCRITRNIVIVC